MKRQRGFSLMELMVVCFIITVLLTVALPNPQVFKRAMQSQLARQNVQQMLENVNVYNACTKVQGADCTRIYAQIPGPVTGFPGLVFNGYRHVFALTTSPYSPSAYAGGGWQYWAIPVTPQDGVMAYLVWDGDTALHCDLAANLATAGDGLAPTSIPLCH